MNPTNDDLADALWAIAEAFDENTLPGLEERLGEGSRPRDQIYYLCNCAKWLQLRGQITPDETALIADLIDEWAEYGPDERGFYRETASGCEAPVYGRSSMQGWFGYPGVPEHQEHRATFLCMLIALAEEGDLLPPVELTALQGVS